MAENRINCFEFTQQEFLICITIHKARSLCTFNADTYVKITLDKKVKCTKVFQNSESPYFNEYFVFEESCSLVDLLRQTILFQVFKRNFIRKDINLGELYIDLATIWHQGGHMIFKKWGKLEVPAGTGDPDGKSRGHLQIDIAIVSKNDPIPAPNFEDHDFDDIEQNLLRPDPASSNIENVRYYVTIYRGVFLKKADYVVQVTLAGFLGKTKLAKGCTHPEWNEQFSFSWILPSLCRTFLIQVFANEIVQSKCICNCEVHLNEISYSDGIPSFGPSYVHFYDPVDPMKYIGRLLITIRTEQLQKHLSPLRCILSKKVPPLADSTYWNVENFVIVALIWAGDSIQLNWSAVPIKFGLKCGEWHSNLTEVPLKDYSSSDGVSVNLKYFKQNSPIKTLRLSGFFPDNRWKYQHDYFMRDLVEFMKIQLSNYKMFEIKYDKIESILTKCLRKIIASIEEKIRQGVFYEEMKKSTELDKQRLRYIVDYLDSLQTNLGHYQKILKITRKNYSPNIGRIYSDLTLIIKDMERLIEGRIQDLWPDVILYFSRNEVVFGYCRLNPMDYMFSIKPGGMGRLCGPRHNMIFKYSNCKHTCQNCGCIAAKVDGWLWIGTENEFQEHCQPAQWIRNEPFVYSPTVDTKFTVKIYLHQGKIRPGNEKIIGQCQAQVQVILLEYMQQSKTICHSLSPLWNQVITFENMILPGDCQSYMENPVFALVKLFCLTGNDSKNISNYLGCTILRLAVRGRLANDKGDPITSNFTDKIDPIDALSNVTPPPLKWIPIVKDGAVKAEILISGELIENSEVSNDSSRIKITENLPVEICPVNQKFRIEVAFVGLRNFHKSLPRAPAGKCRMKLTFANLSLTSGPSGLRYAESINFDDCFSNGYVYLPEQLEYWPPIILTHTHSIKNNQEISIGAAMLPNSSKYLIQTKIGGSTHRTVTFEGQKFERIADSDIEPQMETSFFSDGYAETTPLLDRKRQDPQRKYKTKWQLIQFLLAKFKEQPTEIETEKYRKAESEFCWWTKFYNSVGSANEAGFFDSRKGRLVIYGSELEKQVEFNFFQDWAESIPLIRGVQRRFNASPIEETYGNAKCRIEIGKCTSGSLTSSISDDKKLLRSRKNEKFQQISSLVQETQVIVRVYIVQGLRLRSRDMYSESDPFVKVQYGTEVISDRANYIQNQSNPVFGRMFQMDGTIPHEHILHISVYDRDIVDDLIGSTSIDLEDRFRTKYRATVGLANEYSESGFNCWRDLKSPMSILKEIADIYDLDPPEIYKDAIKFAGKTFEDTSKAANGENIGNRLCLHVLKCLHKIPEIGYKLVPEHVETRSLYRNDRPGIEQGKLQLWVEIYEKDNVPPALDITPIPPRKYELRVIIYNTSDVVLDESNVFGKKMSDIYLKGWLENIDQAQYTDVHYRSLNGQGNFNWRMIFELRYSRVEDMMVLTRKAAIYERFDTELKVPPVLYLQIWDNDVFSPDDFLGVININLSHFPKPASTARNCSLKNDNKFVNLFLARRVRGWFPARGTLARGGTGLTGKVEMQLQILTEAEASARPAGLGRDSPDALVSPKRPDTSFNWYSNPLLSLKHILLPQLTKCGCFICLFVFIIVSVFVIIYAGFN